MSPGACYSQDDTEVISRHLKRYIDGIPGHWRRPFTPETSPIAEPIYCAGPRTSKKAPSRI